MKAAQQETRLGTYYIGDTPMLLRSTLGERFRNQVQLLITSPPFPLNEKKSYGNLTGDDYLKWFINLAPLFANLLTNDGSIVIEIGNAWESGRPVQSLLPMESLMGFVKHRKAGLRLCQQFICYNPSRLPSPAEWVTVRRIRVTDSYTHIWWMAKTDFPKANNSRVLRPYSKSMQRLHKTKSYNGGKRPSGHDIGATSFLTEHEGSIMQNVIELESMDDENPSRLPFNTLRFSNANSNEFFLRTCRERNIEPHPARIPEGLVAFFIELLTDPGDLVLDPFAGSNTTGFVAESLNRRWCAIDIQQEYIEQSKIRFDNPILCPSEENR